MPKKTVPKKTAPKKVEADLIERLDRLETALELRGTAELRGAALLALSTLEKRISELENRLPEKIDTIVVGFVDNVNEPNNNYRERSLARLQALSGTG